MLTLFFGNTLKIIFILCHFTPTHTQLDVYQVSSTLLSKTWYFCPFSPIFSLNLISNHSYLSDKILPVAEFKHVGLSLFSQPFLPLQFISMCLALPSKLSLLTSFYSFPTPEPSIPSHLPYSINPHQTSLYLLWPLFSSCTGLLSAPYTGLVINSHLRPSSRGSRGYPFSSSRS